MLHGGCLNSRFLCIYLERYDEYIYFDMRPNDGQIYWKQDKELGPLIRKNA